MTNKIKMDLNDKNFQNVAAAIAKDISDSGAKYDTFDEMYQTIGKYVNVTKEQFEDYYKQAEENLAAYKTNHELCEDELDMVVGGGLGSWLSEHALTIGIVAAGIVLVAASGGLLGAGLGAGLMAVTGDLTVAGGAAWGAAYLGGTAGLAAICGGGIAIYNNAFKDGLN